MAIDVVIPLGKGSQWGNNELRYSLRSLEEFGVNVGQVFIIGECPEWINTTPVKHEGVIINNNHVVHIPSVDKYGHERNIMEKILLACRDERVSQNFLFWNDDFFLTDFIDCEKYPFYYSGTLQDRVDERIKGDGYRISLANTCNHLKLYGENRLFFDIHCPIIYSKTLFESINNYADWTVRNGYVIKSLYANKKNYISAGELIQMPDLKFSKVISKADIAKRLEGRHIFSVADSGLFRDMKEFLKELYPNPSRYEQ